MTDDDARDEHLLAKFDALIRERDEALRKQAIDQEQCDKMTALAAELSAERRSLVERAVRAGWERGRRGHSIAGVADRVLKEAEGRGA